ncbi:MAG: glutamyl-tRNA reductase [Burkholderiales bacterium]|jgi:glutamyl-tRNA reductase
MAVIALGLNHTTAPLELRSRFALPIHELGAALRGFTAQTTPPPELTIISTCNRTELYLGQATPRPQGLSMVHFALDCLARTGRVSAQLVREHSYVHEGPDAARHAFRVASGLDSMVLGEPQILGQMKAAVREADSAGTLGTTLHQMFQRSFAVAKQVRSSTEIGAHSISMAAAAVRLAGQLFENLSELRVLFIGAGEMIELVATHFAAKNPRSMTVANRSLERGEKLASRINAEAIRLHDIPARLAEFDVVISCTASPLPILGLGATERALKARKRRPMFMVDLAVPPDIEPEVGQLPDVYLYTVDDLSSMVQTAGEKRQAAVEQAEAIIETGVQSFVHWMDRRSSVPLILALQEQAQEWQAIELRRARKLLSKGEPLDKVLESLARGLTQKMLHGSLAELHATEGPQRQEWAQTLSRLFLRKADHLP